MTNLITIEVTVDEHTRKWIQEVADGTGTTLDQCASVLVYVSLRNLLKEEGYGQTDETGS
jgi:hypothetical protein